MREYIYKIIIFAIAIIVIFEFTIGKEISQINEKVGYFTSSDGRKEMITSLKEEIEKANKKDKISFLSFPITSKVNLNIVNLLYNKILTYVIRVVD